ncbi:hypothetical protein LTR10_003070 [Elasticomyces elasticus]|nr:hypothetical protein LTR10_003070 [Elasticomyces elasticus]KAK4969346.1 hypothetical protein LTR42_008613 [Elasticomyces elasticus]
MVDNPRDGSSPQTKGLLALPAELREQIYELLVVKPRKSEVSDRTDLETALRWLSAIGELNVSRLSHLALCGWTRVPFGHMMVRRWVRVVLDLKEGIMEMEDSETLPDRSQLMVAIRNMKESFGAMVASREGRRFDLDSLTGLMSGFHSMCEAYKAA